VAPAENSATEPTPELDLTVRTLLSAMPDELAQALVYHHLDGMGYDEIARVMSCSRRHVGNLLRRARDWVAAHQGEA
jgi:RNA polymerase sigma-70 factor (ECF subfamily)